VSVSDKSSNRRQRQSSVEGASYWFAFRRRWFLILFLGVALSAGTGFVVWRFLPPPKASAHAVYEISVDVPAVLQRLPDEREFNSFKQNQANLITKRSVLGQILDEPGITAIKECAGAKDPYRWLEQTLKIDFKMGKEYLRVTADLEKADDALALVKAVDKCYLNEAVVKEKQRRFNDFSGLKTLHGQKQKSLDEELAKLREISQKGGAPNERIAALQQEFIQQSLNHAQAERLHLAADIRRLRIELAGRKAEVDKSVKDAPPEHLVRAELEASPQLKAERGHLEQLQLQLKDYRKELAEGASTLRLAELTQAVTAQKAIVDELPTKLRAAAVEAARAKQFITSSAENESLAGRLATAEALEKKLEGDSKVLAENIKQLTSTQSEFERSRIQISQLEKLTESLSGMVTKMDIELGARDRVARFQEPTVTVPDDFTRRLKFTAIAALAGLVAGSIPVWLLEFRRRVFHEESQLQESVPLPLIGTIPHIPRKRRSMARAAVVAQPRVRAMVTESIDSTRATVLFKLQETGGRSVMITSSVAGEAKSSVSGHIGISLARAGFRTLIIDSDMRRPTLHRVFDVHRSPGFSDVMLGKCGLDDVVQPSQLQNLFILSAGDWIPAASAKLAAGAWSELLRDAKDQFDIVIVDSPPVLLVADALAMAREVDAVLLSALKEVSEIDLINRSVERLQSVGVVPMGLIASGITHRTYSAPYYSRYAAAYSKRRSH
jgi:succinoglycan biosynthesis transport protein ExoP